MVVLAHFWRYFLQARRDLRDRKVVELAHFWNYFPHARRDLRVQKVVDSSTTPMVHPGYGSFFACFSYPTGTRWLRELLCFALLCL